MNKGKYNKINKNNSENNMSIKNKNGMTTYMKIGTTIKTETVLNTTNMYMCYLTTQDENYIVKMPIEMPIVKNEQILNQKQDFTTNAFVNTLRIP